jgi:hypothetical protein
MGGLSLFIREKVGYPPFGVVPSGHAFLELVIDNGYMRTDHQKFLLAAPWHKLSLDEKSFSIILASAAARDIFIELRRKASPCYEMELDFYSAVVLRCAPGTNDGKLDKGDFDWWRSIKGTLAYKQDERVLAFERSVSEILELAAK